MGFSQHTTQRQTQVNFRLRFLEKEKRKLRLKTESLTIKESDNIDSTGITFDKK